MTYVPAFKMRRLTISTMPKPKRGYYPFIRLSGQWLEQAGFQPGERVLVQVENGKLVISKETQ